MSVLVDELLLRLIHNYLICVPLYSIFNCFMELILQLQVCSDLSHIARSCSRGYLSYITVSLWHVLLCVSAPALGYWWLAFYFNNSLLPSPVLRPCLSYSVTLSLPATQTLATLEWNIAGVQQCSHYTCPHSLCPPVPIVL